jgi:hypothetical protein
MRYSKQLTSQRENVHFNSQFRWLQSIIVCAVIFVLVVRQPSWWGHMAEKKKPSQKGWAVKEKKEADQSPIIPF